MSPFSDEARKATAQALDRLQRRGPFNAEIAQLQLLHAWEDLSGTLPIPPPDAIANAAYGFWESGAESLALRCCDQLGAFPGYGYDTGLLRFRSGHPGGGGIPPVRLLLATNVGHLPREEANQRQAYCVERLERTRDEDGNIGLLNLGFPEEFHGRPGWTERPLTRSARDLVAPSCPRMPVMRDILQGACEVAEEQGFPYFAFVNSDILLPPEGLHTIRRLAAEGFETMGLTRTDIPSREQEGREHWIGLHISGTDLFAFSTRWWRDNSHLFDDYIMGAYWWDCVFMGILMVHSRCCYVSQQRGALLHVRHDSVAHGQSLQANYNLALRDGKDYFYFFLHSRYIEQLNAYIRTNRCLPCMRANMDLQQDRFLTELRAHFKR